MPPFPEAAREATSLAIVSEVAARKDVSPTTLDPLYDTVDPDAVDALLEREFEGAIEFEYAGCIVRVRGDGSISIADSREQFDGAGDQAGQSALDG